MTTVYNSRHAIPCLFEVKIRFQGMCLVMVGLLFAAPFFDNNCYDKDDYCKG